MQILEGIFYTNLTEDLTQFIAEIKKKEIIDEYTVFVIFYDYYDNIYQMIYHKYWKSHGCVILDINDNYHTGVSFSNGKYRYLENIYNHSIDKFKKMCTDYDLLELHIKFKYISHYLYVLNNNLYFYFYGSTEDKKVSVIDFIGKRFSVDDFIEVILNNYSECYKYDYSQIKPTIANNSRLCE